MCVGTGGQRSRWESTQHPARGPRSKAAMAWSPTCFPRGAPWPALERWLAGLWEPPPPRAKPEAAPPGDALLSLQGAGGQSWGGAGV